VSLIWAWIEKYEVKSISSPHRIPGFAGDFFYKKNNHTKKKNYLKKWPYRFKISSCLFLYKNTINGFVLIL